ncbi:MAG: DUF2625 family protein [Erysipelotrichaceae bacterium]|nr:DUF2625 family protein [Erysipelotrichaceae bacterium]
MASQPIYELYAELEDYEPKMWRRFQVMQNITVARLGYILMAMYRMEASHLFRFIQPIEENYNRHPDSKEPLYFMKKEIEYILPDEYDDFGTSKYAMDPSQTKLHKVIKVPGDELWFDYDFGDGWRVKVVLEKVFRDPDLPGKELPRILDGDGYGIIEDCGGPGGLTQIAEAFRKGSGKEYEEIRNWLGVEWINMKAFDIKNMNFRVKEFPKVYKRLYEDGWELADPNNTGDYEVQVDVIVNKEAMKEEQLGNVIKKKALRFYEPPVVTDLLPNYLIVAMDIFGGAFVKDTEDNILYFAPDTLDFEETEMKHSQFLYWLDNGNVAEFYEPFLWDAWENFADTLEESEGMIVYPPLWSREYEPDTASRNVILLKELLELNIELRNKLFKE